MLSAEPLWLRPTAARAQPRLSPGPAKEKTLVFFLFFSVDPGRNACSGRLRAPPGSCEKKKKMNEFLGDVATVAPGARGGNGRRAPAKSGEARKPASALPNQTKEILQDLTVKGGQRFMVALWRREASPRQDPVWVAVFSHAGAQPSFD